MDNLMDVYYLVQILVHQIFIYARDIILREFSWFGKPNDKIENVETKMRDESSSKQFITDLVAIFTICCLLVIIVILSAIRGKEESDYSLANMDTRQPRNDPGYKLFYKNESSISLEDDDPFCFSESTTSMITNCLHACGDSIYHRNIFSRINPPKNALKKPPHSLPKMEMQSDYCHYPQNTQTSSGTVLQSEGQQEWLVRRTRSGQVYGKYRI